MILNIKRMEGYFTVSSTRHKNSTTQKDKMLIKNIKKCSTDENEKNYLNYLEKIITINNQTNNTNSKLGLKKSHNMKTSTNQTTTNSKKSLQLLTKCPLTPHSNNTKSISTVNSSVKLVSQKQRSVKNLKLTSSIDLPKMMVKSISQTTVNRKIDDKKLKILQKLGLTNLNKKNIDKQCFFIKKKETSVPTTTGLPSTPHNRRKNTPSISQFNLGKKLGTGRFGNVYIAQEKITKAVYAIKVLSKQKIKESDMEEQIISEIKIQMYMNHPNLLKIYGFFDDSKNIYLVLEYCNQCLFKQLRQKGQFSQQETAYYCKQVISSLKYLHNESIIHRDIKPENILLQHDVLKLSDFGWSIYSPLYKRQTFCGTVDYVPPEIVQGVSYDQRVDIWALGVLIYQMASGYAPFETKDQNITYERILKNDYRFPKHFSEKLKELISWILDKKPANRPNLQQIQTHPWFQQFKSVGRYISKEIWHAWNYQL